MSHYAKYDDYTTKEMYLADNLLWCEPMLAKEIVDEDKQNECLSSPDYIVEEKLDGTRATLHFVKGGSRCFSRRVSEKTGWFCENSDSLPHIRDLDFPDLEGTILDGELRIPDRPFKDVSSTLNCTWDKAIERQEQLGKVVFHAFDILYYKGIRVEMLPLTRRKEFLRMVIDEISSPHIKLHQWYSCDSLIPIEVTEELKSSLIKLKSTYPQLVKDLSKSNSVTPRGYYEFIVATGGEGVIVKPKNGKYHYKRGWEYSKIKKFLTREVIIMGFNPPTEEYKGKFPTVDKWDYWETTEHDLVDLSESTQAEREQFKKNWYPDECRPVSKFYVKNWIGTVRFGVIITPGEADNLPKSKKFNLEEMMLEGKKVLVLEVGECSGFDEETREMLSEGDWVGKVIEVKANEIFDDTGKLRHPRFLRIRADKSPLQCVWADHLTQSIVQNTTKK